MLAHYDTGNINFITLCRSHNGQIAQIEPFRVSIKPIRVKKYRGEKTETEGEA